MCLRNHPQGTSLLRGGGSMGKLDETLHGGGWVSGPALRNDFFIYGLSSCQYPTDSSNY